MPVPTDGEVATNVVVVELHIACAEPAFDVTGDDEVITTVLLAIQEPFTTVHLYVLLDPMVKPVTPEPALLDKVKEPVPETTDHTPVPGEGTVAPKVVVVELQTVCAEPALDVTGA